MKFRLKLTRFAGHLILIFLFCLIFSLKPSFPQEISANTSSIDPFYLRLFDEGKLAFNQGNMEEAFNNFKLAAFGFLDAPELLGEALVYLTVTAYNLKRNDLVEYYLKEISRFKLNNKIPDSKLPPEIRKQFAKIQSDLKNGLKG